MTKVIFIESDGSERVVNAIDGDSLMRVAVANGVSGILAECGGACSCGTCHVHVEPRWLERVGGRSALETSMLELADEFQQNSRLSCQVTVTPELEGLVVRIPRTQG
jgi:ferredoxin, 2Fe-2S